MQQQIFDLLLDAGSDGTTASAIAAKLGVNRVTVADKLKKMVSDGQAEKIKYGVYVAKVTPEMAERASKMLSQVSNARKATFQDNANALLASVEAGEVPAVWNWNGWSGQWFTVVESLDDALANYANETDPDNPNDNVNIVARGNEAAVAIRAYEHHGWREEIEIFVTREHPLAGYHIAYKWDEENACEESYLTTEKRTVKNTYVEDLNAVEINTASNRVTTHIEYDADGNVTEEFFPDDVREKLQSGAIRVVDTYTHEFPHSKIVVTEYE